MLVCRRSPSAGESRSNGEAVPETAANGARLGHGGPVFLPPRKPSAIGKRLLAHAIQPEPATPYDDLWLVGRPTR